MSRFAVNGTYFDFSSIDVGLLGLVRLPEELMSITLGDGLTIPDVEGTGMVPLGFGNGRYKADPIQLKTTLEAAMEIIESPSLPADGFGTKTFPMIIVVQNEGRKPIKFESPETRLMKPQYGWNQGDPSLPVSLDFKPRYLLVNGRCLGKRNR